MQICLSTRTLPVELQRETNHAERARLQWQLEVAQRHAATAVAQRNWVKDLFVRQLADDEAVVMMDFGVASLHLNVSSGGGATASSVPVCSFVVKVGGGQRVGTNAKGQHFIDVLCEDPLVSNNDFYFVRAAILSLLDTWLLGVDRVTFVTDGCSKQFASVFFEKVRKSCYA